MKLTWKGIGGLGAFAYLCIYAWDFYTRNFTDAEPPIERALAIVGKFLFIENRRISLPVVTVLLIVGLTVSGLLGRRHPQLKIEPSLAIVAVLSLLLLIAMSRA
jgi:flagellar biosynthesis protein FliR